MANTIKDIRGKVVVITGAAQGIGFATAREFASAGAVLALSDINLEGLERSAHTLREAGAQVHTFQVDVSDKKQVDEMIRRTLKQTGRIDVLVNNAGIGYSGELESTSLETWQKLIGINFWGPLYHIYGVLPQMKAQGGGQIVNVSSGQAFFRLPTWGAYATVKLALGGFSEILSFELQRYNIQVTTVYPYMVNTGFYDAITPPDTLAGKLSMKLLPYYSDTPEKVAHLVFNAVKKGKRVEMVSLFNDIGFYSRLLPPVSDVVSRAANWLLSGDNGNHNHAPSH